MKQILTALILTTSTLSSGQALPFDFESTTLGMTGYDGATFTIVNNPDTAGNSSSKVAKIVKVNVNDLWAGGKITSVSSLDFSTSASSVLSMKVYTTEPVGTVIKIKLESPYTSEVDAVTTVSGAWETLTFDFGIPAPAGSADLVIMPQPHTNGGGNTFYIDDIEQKPGLIATPRLGPPMTFESGTNPRHLFDFESAISDVVPNPDISIANGSAMVGKITRYLGAPWGGSKIEFVNNLDFTNHPQITMKVWTNAAIGTYVTLKAEKPFWGEERSVQTTKTGEWETLTFNFTNAPTDMNVLAFMFDFVAGSSNVGDGSAGSTFYFDEVKYANVPLYTTEHNASMNYELYPNPTQNQWTLRNTSGKMLCGYIFNSSGQLYETLDFNDQEIINIDASQYPSGTYVLKITYTSREETLKLFKL
jgi:hypothetical protein